MSGTVRPWNKSSHYIAATQCLLRPGGMNNYVVPRRIGHSPFDVTGFIFGQAEWDEDNLPEIMYILEAPQGWNEFRRSALPPQKKDANGNPMFERYPRPVEPGKPLEPREPLLNFWILPDVIGTQEGWWYFETVQRIHPRVRWIDMTMRMPLEGRPDNNSLNQNSGVKRAKYGMQSWFPKPVRQAQNSRRDTALTMLSNEQITANTTRGTTPGPINPAVGEAGGRILYPARRKGEGVRRGPRKKVSLEDWRNEAEDESSENEHSNSWKESVAPEAKQSRIKTQHSQFDISAEWRWVGDVLYDGKGLGKSRPKEHRGFKEGQLSAGAGKKRKADDDDRELSELSEPPRKKPIINWPRPSAKTLECWSFQLPQDFGDRVPNPFTQSIPLTHHPESTTAQRDPHHGFDWDAIEHATPYDTNSYANFFRGLSWDNWPTPGGHSYNMSHQSQPTARSNHSVARDSRLQRATNLRSINQDQSLQSNSDQKRKRDDTPSSVQNGHRTTKKPRTEGPMVEEPPSGDVRAESYKARLSQSEQPVMVVILPRQDNKRRRGQVYANRGLSEESIDGAESSGNSVDPVINYHYPPVLPAQIEKRQRRPH